MKVLVTGAAGFIGYHLSEQLLSRGDLVVGLDNVNDYYDVALKQARLARLRRHDDFKFIKANLADTSTMTRLFATERFDRVVNLAAQAGVRYSIDNPQRYVESNVVGFLNVLEGCRNTGVQHLVYASSSSVYGANTAMPFSVSQVVDHPVSFYAATKRANELMAHSYSHLYRVPTTGLRFFTVYGPWGRPDMATFLFAERILKGEPIDVFNHGRMRRDFTYVDDIVEGVVRVLDRTAESNPAWNSHSPDSATSAAPYRLYNIGNNEPVELLHIVALLERYLGRPAKVNLMPIQPGDVLATWADVDDLQRDIGFRPKTSIEEGLLRFVEWYREYYEITPERPRGDHRHDSSFGPSGPAASSVLPPA